MCLSTNHIYCINLALHQIEFWLPKEPPWKLRKKVKRAKWKVLWNYWTKCNSFAGIGANVFCYQFGLWGCWRDSQLIPGFQHLMTALVETQKKLCVFCCNVFKMVDNIVMKSKFLTSPIYGHLMYFLSPGIS